MFFYLTLVCVTSWMYSKVLYLTWKQSCCISHYSENKRERNGPEDIGFKHASFYFNPPAHFLLGDRCRDGQGRQSPLRALGHMGWKDGVLPSDAEQPWGRERHGGQTEDGLSNSKSQRGVEEEPATVSFWHCPAGCVRVCKPDSCTQAINTPSLPIKFLYVIVPACSGLNWFLYKHYPDITTRHWRANEGNDPTGQQNA